MTRRTAPALICSACWPQAKTMHPCRHGRRFLHLIASSVAVRAAYAFGDWPPPRVEVPS